MGPVLSGTPALQGLEEEATPGACTDFCDRSAKGAPRTHLLSFLNYFCTQGDCGARPGQVSVNKWGAWTPQLPVLAIWSSMTLILTTGPRDPLLCLKPLLSIGK